MKLDLIARTFRRLPSVPANTFLFISFLFYFTRFSSLDPEVHHDGVMTAAAIAVSEGRFPNRDVFAQYGPLAPLMQGLWIHFTEPSLISLRNFTAVLLAATAILLVILLSRFTNKFMAWLITGAWATSYPFFILPVNLPWSSVITTLFSLLILLLILNTLTMTRATPLFYFMTITASCLACISIFSRIHMVLTVLSLALFSICFQEKKLKSLYLKIWAFTSMVTLFGIIALLSLVGALSPYLNQSILWASKRYVGNEGLLGKAQLMEQLLLLLFPILSFTFYAADRFLKAKSYSLLSRISITLLILAVAPISIIQVVHKSYLNPKYAAVSFSQNYTNLIGYLTATFLVYLFVRALIHKSLTPLRLAVGFFGISILSQLYPLHDILHLYWITPVLIVVVAVWIDTDRNIFDDSKLRTLKIVLLALLCVNLILSAYNLSISRVDYQANSVLYGMKGNADKVRSVQKTIDAVNFAAELGDIEFDCMDGIYAVSGGRYLPSGLNFVNWGPKVKSHEETKYILACNLSKSEVTQISSRNKVQALIPIDADQSNVLYQRGQEQ
jgi:hypothetical protein